MSAPLYLVTPLRFEPERLAETLHLLLGTGLVACVRLALAAEDEAAWRAAARPLREVTEAADVALVIDTHYRLVAPLGLDGVHLPDGRAAVKTVRQALGPERTIGCFAGASRHQGMVLGEAGADYVSFGPVGDPGPLGAPERADPELFAWWAEMIETPVVAEGAVGLAEAKALAGLADFLVPDAAVFAADDPVAELEALAEAFAG